MHATASDSGALRVVMERLGGLTAALVELKTLVLSMDARQRQDALDRVGVAAMLEAKITAAHNRLDVQANKLDEHTTDIKALETVQQATDRRLSPLEAAYRLMAFVASALGLSVTALIWALITGQVQLVFGG